MKSHVVLTRAEWESFRPLLIENGIKFEPSGYGVDIYVGFNDIDQATYNKIDELLELI